jgi:hypothetical protein
MRVRKVAALFDSRSMARLFAACRPTINQARDIRQQCTEEFRDISLGRKGLEFRHVSDRVDSLDAALKRDRLYL